MLRKSSDIAELIWMTPDGGLQAEFPHLIKSFWSQKVIDYLRLELARRDRLSYRAVIDARVQVPWQSFIRSPHVRRVGEDPTAALIDGYPRCVAMCPVDKAREVAPQAVKYFCGDVDG